MTFGASHSDVEARLAREAPFTASTSPTDTEVDGWVAEAAAIVRQTLRAVGVAQDPASGTDGEIVCRALVVKYALALTLEVLAFAEDAAVGSERATVLMQEFTGTLAEWRSMGTSNLASYLSPTGAVSPSTQTLRSHVTTGGQVPPDPRYTLGDLDRSF